jgi:hypothetical protein
MTSTDIGIAQLALKRWELASINWPRNKIQRFHLDSSSKHFWSNNKGQKIWDLVFINEIHYDNAGTDVEKELK